MKAKRKINWQEHIARFLFLTLIGSMIYSLVRIVLAPETTTELYVNVKSDYILMFIQCLLGVLVMMLPSFIEHRFKIDVPDFMTILFYIFLYCAIYLGEVRSFYYLVPHWDSILHTFSGAMLAVTGFMLVDVLNKSESIRVNLSPIFVSLFAFSFALMVGALWEIYEFSFDAILGLNMQKTVTSQGVVLAGKAAVSDTMKDLILDALAALGIAIIGYFTQTRQLKQSDDQIVIR